MGTLTAVVRAGIKSRLNIRNIVRAVTSQEKANHLYDSCPVEQLFVLTGCLAPHARQHNKLQISCLGVN